MCASGGFLVYRKKLRQKKNNTSDQCKSHFKTESHKTFLSWDKLRPIYVFVSMGHCLNLLSIRFSSRVIIRASKITVVFYNGRPSWNWGRVQRIVSNTITRHLACDIAEMCKCSVNDREVKVKSGVAGAVVVSQKCTRLEDSRRSWNWLKLFTRNELRWKSQTKYKDEKRVTAIGSEIGRV